MSEPHQRSRSGKLRKSVKGQGESKKEFAHRIVYKGIENATELDTLDADDHYSTTLQTPTVLCNSQVKILQQIALGYGITSEDAIDRCFRRVWNIGSWNIKDYIAISINVKQPNIAGCWANIHRVNVPTVEKLVENYKSINLPKSTCSISGSGINSQVKGRWTLNVVSDIIAQGLAQENDIEIASLNISQSSIFCWIILNTESKYLCYLTRQSLEIMSKYVPEWCLDVLEPNAAGALTLKLRHPPIINDSTQVSISVSGAIQYQGRAENIKQLHKAVSICITSVIESLHMKLFIESLEYKTVVEDSK